MKRVMLLVTLLCAVRSISLAQISFTPGNLAVVRYGEVKVTPVTGGTSIPVYIDEYSPAGTLVKSIAVPEVAGAGNAPSISEGSLALSPDGSKISFMAYKAKEGVTGLASSDPQSVNRVVVTVGTGYNTINTTTILNNIKGSPRAAVTDADNCWLISSTGGLHYVKLGSSGAASSIVLQPGSGKSLNIINGDIYLSTNAGSAVRLQKIASLPTASAKTIAMSGFSTTGNPYGFVFFDTDPTIQGVDLAYVADDSNPSYLQKYSFDGNIWRLQGQLEITKGTNKILRGLTGTIQDGKPVLYGTTSTSILKFVDEAPRTSDINAVTSVLINKKTGTQEVFKGISFVPGTQIFYSLK